MRFRTALYIVVLPILITISGQQLQAQVTGVPPSGLDLPEATPADDSLYLFTPARPLIDTNGLKTQLSSALGVNLMFSNSGYGMGLFFEKKFSSSFSGFIDFGITAARAGDELEVYNFDPNSVHYQSYYVPNKINRVWHAPTMIGVKQGIFSNAFFNNFRPFVNAGAGATVIMTTPYEQGFFSAFGDAAFSVAPGGFLGVGAEFTEKSPGIAFNIRYYYLPKDPGVESVRNEPITNFGGLFLMLNVPL